MINRRWFVKSCAAYLPLGLSSNGLASQLSLPNACMGFPLSAQEIIAIAKDPNAAVDAKNKHWTNARTLKVHFMDMDVANDNVKRVIDIASEWTLHANLKFDFFCLQGMFGQPFVPVPKQILELADIRVTFRRGSGCWSVVGNDSRWVCRSGWKPSMCLADSFKYGEDFVKGSILHEFGHALGLHHEHQNPKGAFHWNEEKVYAYYRKQGWEDAKIKANVIDRLSEDEVNSTEYDPKSIMLYWFPKEFTVEGVEGKSNTSLSDLDKSTIAAMYPK